MIDGGISISEKPWIEKYRPQVLDTVVGNSDILSQLREIGKKGNIPHMILSGPPGTGKTTSLLALAKELLGESYKTAVIELNASDERGIDVVRERIKAFANQKVKLPEGRHKIIILDEADSMTDTAQQALRVIISDYSHDTRFVFACNDSSKIIEAIQSRCVILRFSKLKTEEIRQNLLRIIKSEGLDYDEEGIEALLYTSEGDMRYAVNNLQSTAIGLGVVNKENVYKLVDIPRPEKLMNLLESCLKINVDGVISDLDELMSEGYSVLDIVNVFSRVVQDSEVIRSNEFRCDLLKEVSLFKMQVLEGVDSNIQLYGFISRIIRLCEKVK